MSPISHGNHGPSSSSETVTSPNLMSSEPLDCVDLILEPRPINAICDIDPTDSNRFLCAFAQPDGSFHYDSYAFADLPSLLLVPGPPFYASAIYRTDAQTTPKACMIDPYDNQNFLYEVSPKVFQSYPIVDIPSLIESTGAPSNIPLGMAMQYGSVPNHERSWSTNQAAHHERDASARALGSPPFENVDWEYIHSIRRQRNLLDVSTELDLQKDALSRFQYYLQNFGPRISNDKPSNGIYHSTNLPHTHLSEEINLLKCPFCINAIGTGSWLLHKDQKELLVASHGCPCHRALLLRTQGWNPTPAETNDFYGISTTCTVHASTTISSGTVSGRHDSDFLTNLFRHGRSPRMGHDAERIGYISGMQPIVADYGVDVDVEKGHHFAGDESGVDERFRFRDPRIRSHSHFMRGKRALGKRLRSMIFWIVIAVLVLGMWLDSMHESRVVVGGVEKGDFGAGGEVWDGGDGQKVFPQLDPGAPDLG
ncbi:MAG: hypothetical protein Q9168_002355 [Polycauliona sp. 1 TL-2023]